MTITKETAASFSKFAYEGSTFVLPQSWSNAGWDVILQGNRTDGYHGKVFVKVDSATNTATELVIAHRGTEPTDVNDLLADVQLALTATAQQVNESETFFGEAQSAYLQYLNDEGITGGSFNTITTNVGHSLGGYLAIHAADHMEDQTPNSGKAIVFDNPASGLTSTNATIDNYLNHANHINKAGGNHLGTIYRIQDRDFRFSSEDKASIVNTMVAAVDTALMIVNGPAEFLDTLSAGLTGSITDWALLPTSAANTFQEHSIDSIITRLNSAQLESTTYNTSAIESFLIGDYASNNGVLGGIINEHWTSDFDAYGLTKNQLGDALVAVLNDPNYNPATNQTYFIGGLSGDDMLIGGADGDVILTQDGNDVIDAGAGDHIIDAGEGSDTISYASLVGPVGINVDLGVGNSYVGSVTGQPKDIFAHVENVTGSDFADTIVGNVDNNELQGNGGDDQIDGGANYDIAVYSGDFADYTIAYDVTHKKWSITDNDTVGGDDGTDTLTDVEVAKFADREYQLVPDCTEDCGDGGGGKRRDSSDAEDDTTLNLTSDAYINGDVLNYDVSLTHGAGADSAVQSNYMIIMDVSGSMGPIGSGRILAAKQAAIAYINSTSAGDSGGNNHYAVTTFASSASTTGQMTASQAISAIESLGLSEGTNFAAGISAATSHFESLNATTPKQSVFFSDGGDVGYLYYGDGTDSASNKAAYNQFKADKVGELHAISQVKVVGDGTANANELDELDNTGGSQAISDQDGDGDIDGDDYAIIFNDPGMNKADLDRIEVSFNGQVMQTILPNQMNDGLHGISQSGSIDVSSLTPSTSSYDLSATLYYSNGSPSVTASIPLSFGFENVVTSSGSDDLVVMSATAYSYDAGAGEDEIIGNGLGNMIVGGDDNDQIQAGGGNDVVELGSGDNILDGGTGYDTARYAHNLADYTITQIGETTYVAYTGTGGDSNDTLVNTEFLEFADGVVSVADTTSFAPTLGYSNIVASEGASGTSSVDISFTLSQAATVDVTFDYTTADISAVAGNDYFDQNGTVTILAGQTSTTETFRIIGDSISESPESFRIEIANIQGAQLDESLGDLIVEIDETGSAPNADPTLTDDIATTDENLSVIIDVSANDTDPEDTPFIAANLTILEQPAHGSLTINGDGTVTYSPDTGYNGADSFTYNASDSQGSDALVPATVNVTVTASGLTITHSGDATDNDMTGTSSNDVMHGFAGNDTIFATSGADTLIGGKGVDRLIGSQGNDTYIWKSGDGNDVVAESPSYDSGSTDTLHLTDGVTLADLEIFAVPNRDVHIIHTPSNETIILEDQMNGLLVERLLFDDGTTYTLPADIEWYGTAGNDTIVGTNSFSDSIIGGLGDDTLQGNGVSDHYYWASGDGNDFIKESSNGGSADTLHLTGGILASDLKMYAELSRDFKIVHTPTGEVITIDNQLNTLRLENITFDDGSGLTLTAAVEWRGTAGNDSIVGTNSYSDTILGLDGDDTLVGNGVADELVGGLGADTLNGGSGGDTFVYNDIAETGVGAGNRDEITSYSYSSGDRIDVSGIGGLNFVAGGNGVSDFTGAGNEIAYINNGNNRTWVQIDTDGDSLMDAEIQINNSLTMTANDFLV